jgi:hypothetical protein
MAFPTNTNKRVFYATQGVAVGDRGATTLQDSPAGSTAQDSTGKLTIVHGLQSLGVTTNFNLEQIFELGQLSLYENREDIPEIEVTFEKLLDGYSLVYHLGTNDATNATLTGRADARCDVRAIIGYATEDNIVAGSTNSGVAELYCSGMYVSSVSYNLATDGNFTESTTFVGNDKAWLTGASTDPYGTILVAANGTINSAFSSSVFSDDAPIGVGNSVLRRENVVIGADGKELGMVGSGAIFRTVVPNFIEGNTTVGGTWGVSGTATSPNASNIGTGLGTNASIIPTDGTLYVNSFSCSVDLGREAINQMGKRTPYYRYVSFPVDVTADIEVVAVGGDNINAAEEAQNLSNHSIQFVLDDSTVIQLGNKNKTTSVSYGGGDAGGGNATITYSMTNSNDFVILHSGDPLADPTRVGPSGYFKNYFSEITL